MNKVFEFRNIKKLLDNYGPEIASVVSLVCIGLSGYSAFKASGKVVQAKQDYDDAVEAVKEEEEKFEEERGRKVAEEEHAQRMHKVKLQYGVDCLLAEKWTIGFGIGAIVSELIGHHMQGEKIAILAGGLSLSQDKIKKFVKKTKETIGEEQFEKIKQDIRAENISEAIEKNPDLKKILERDDVPGNEGSVCFEQYYDEFTGSLYEMPESQLNDAKQCAYEYFGKHGELEFSKWRSMCGLPDCIAGKTFTFNDKAPFDIKISPMKYGDKWIKAIEYPGRDEVLIRNTVEKRTLSMNTKQKRRNGVE